MIEVRLSRPSDKQRLFLLDHHRYVAFGGSRGGGKSWAVQTKAKLLALKHSGIRISIFRRTYPELETNHIRVLVPQCEQCGIARYNKLDKRLTFINGSVIEFRFAQREADLSRMQGQQWDVIFVDEATQWSEQELKMLSACCRGTGPYPRRVYYTCNPGGPGHQYIKRVFLDRKFRDGEDPDDYSFIQSKVTDNAALMRADPEYVRYLEALPPKLKKAWLDGDWDTMSGAFFDDFVIGADEQQEDRTHTHVIKAFEPPRSWQIMMGYDFGYSKPFSAAWYAVDEDGRLYRILEWYGCNGEPNEGLHMPPDEQFKHIHEIETQHPWLKGKRIRRIADPAIWQADSGKSVAETASQYGVYFEPGDHSRIAGWMQCHYRLSFDEHGIPMFYVFDTCKEFIRTIPLLQYDDHKVEDLDSDLEDHIADEWRYVCMSRPIKPRVIPKVQERGDDPLNQRLPKRRSVYISHG